LPLADALGLLDVGEGVAGKADVAVLVPAKELAVLAFDHGMELRPGGVRTVYMVSVFRKRIQARRAIALRGGFQIE
jgi:hypothetical protein